MAWFYQLGKPNSVSILLFFVCLVFFFAKIWVSVDVDAVLDWYFLLCVSELKEKGRKKERRCFLSFAVNLLPHSRCPHLAADLKFVTSHGQNWFPARIPFEQRGPLWRGSCHVRLTKRQKSCFCRGRKLQFAVVFVRVSAAVHANFLTIQARPWNRAMQTDSWLIRSAGTSRENLVLVCSLPEEMSKAGSHKAVCVLSS